MIRRSEVMSFLLGASVIAIASFSAHPTAAYTVASQAEQEKTPPPSPHFIAEKGKFRIVVAGQESGKEEFEISPSGDGWIAHATAQLSAQGAGATRVTATLRFKADGSPVHYEWAVEGAKKASSTVDFSGGTATIELRLEGARPFTQQFFFNSPRVVILDNNFFHQYAILARLYDWTKKGAQSFSVLVPQAMTPGTVTAEALPAGAVGGTKFDVLRVSTEDLQIDLYLDNLKLVRVSSPSANAEAIRE